MDIGGAGAPAYIARRAHHPPRARHRRRPPAARRARGRRPADRPRDRHGRRAAVEAARPHADERGADEALRRPDRGAQHGGPGAQRGPGAEPQARSGTRARSTPSAAAAACADRCTASPCWSRTTSTCAACRQRPARWRSSIPSRTRTPRSSRALRRAGAVILGKTNLSEFAYFTTSGSPERLLLARRPGAERVRHRPRAERLVLGSAAAASAGLAALTIGTETSGSIISPSAAQGIVGMRPTLGLVSRTGILPIAASQDTAGPMTRTVADAAAELQAIAGEDPEDPATADQPDVPDYAAALDADALDGARLGVVSSNDPNYQAALAVVRARGARDRGDPGPGEHDRAVDPQLRVQARSQRLPRPARAARAAPVARRDHRLQRAPPRGGAEVRPDAADRQRGDRPRRPGHARDVRGEPRPGPRRGAREPRPPR